MNRWVWWWCGKKQAPENQIPRRGSARERAPLTCALPSFMARGEGTAGMNRWVCGWCGKKQAPPKPESARGRAALTCALPSFIVLKSHEEGGYMGYIHDDPDETANGYLTFTQTQAVSPFAKFQVETAGTDGAVRIRSCQNNRYWLRTHNRSIAGNPEEQYWITATATEPENDPCKEGCTLFRPQQVDAVRNTVRFVHLQSGCYLSVWGLNRPPFNRPVQANHKVHGDQGADIFTVIDWESLTILPRFVAFKGHNHRYLCLRGIEGHPYLQFAADDIGDSTAAAEIVTEEDGNIRIKSVSADRFWKRSPNWIWADSNGARSCLFKPIKVDSKTIGLLNLGNHKFCTPHTMQGKTNCLNAALPSITREAQLIVEEPVLRRSIYDVKYDIHNARIYDQNALLLAQNSASNHGRQRSFLEVKLSYTDTRTSTWKTTLSLQLGAKASLKLDVPFILNGKIEMSGEGKSDMEWGEEKTTTTVVDATHNVVVPAMTKVTVNLTATKATIDVPFKFMQRDTLYTGTTVTTEVHGGTYTGANYYNTSFETTEENLCA